MKVKPANSTNRDTMAKSREGKDPQVDQEGGPPLPSDNDKLAPQSQAPIWYDTRLVLSAGALSHDPDGSISGDPARILDMAANLDCISGDARASQPWKSGLPRIILVGEQPLPKPKENPDTLTIANRIAMISEAASSPSGQQHLWVYSLDSLSDYDDLTSGIVIPANLCLMLRIERLHDPAHCWIHEFGKLDIPIRGLLFDPALWMPKVGEINLENIHWVVLGGLICDHETGPIPFNLNWAIDLSAHCRNHKVPFLLHRLGSHPIFKGESLTTTDPHGTDSKEWPDDKNLVRQFPDAFYRGTAPSVDPADQADAPAVATTPPPGGKTAKKPGKKSRVIETSPADPIASPDIQPDASATIVVTPKPDHASGQHHGDDSGQRPRPTPAFKPMDTIKAEHVPASESRIAKDRFEHLDYCVRQGIASFVNAGLALWEIHEKQLWKAGGFKSWQAYLAQVPQIDRKFSYPLMRGAHCANVLEAKMSKIGDTFPRPAALSQVLPLLKLPDEETRLTAWTNACKARADGSAPTAREVHCKVKDILGHSTTARTTIPKRRFLPAGDPSLHAMFEAIQSGDLDEARRLVDLIKETLAGTPDDTKPHGKAA